MPLIEIRCATLTKPYTYTEYRRFIRLCVLLVQGSDVYKAYEEDLIRDSGKQIHHGPIFSLTDICTILTEWYFAKDGSANTTDVVDSVISEHQLGRVEVMLVSDIDHKVLHMNSSFVDRKALVARLGVIGNLEPFNQRYGTVIPKELMEKYDEYFECGVPVKLVHKGGDK